MEFIDLKKQYRLNKTMIDKAIHKVLDHGRFIMGPEIQELEMKLAEYVKSEYCIGVSSGTDALIIALMALDVQPGDEVITTPFTWISTATVISFLRAKPVFVDIDPESYNLDPKLLERAITKKTKAIMPVSLYGQVAELEKINEIAKKYNVCVIEDAAQSFGAMSHGKKSCNISEISTTSFFPAKPLGCYGDGGAIFTKNKSLYEKMKAIRTHGGKVRHNYDYVGMNGRLDTLQAAIVLEKLKFFDEEIEKRQNIAKRYNEALRDVAKTPEVQQDSLHSYAQYTIRCSNRDKLKNSLSEKNIPTAIYYPKCLHEQTVFQNLNYEIGSFVEAEKASKQVLSLPMHPYLSKKDQDYIIENILNHFLIEATL